MLIYLRIKAYLINYEKRIENFCLILNINLLISITGIGVFFELINRDNVITYICIVQSIYIARVIFTFLNRRWQLTDLEKKILVCNRKTKNDNANKLIDEIIIACRKKNTIRINKWAIYDTITIHNENKINEPVLTICTIYENNTKIELAHYKPFMLYPMGSLIPNIFLKEFLIILVEKKGLSTIQLEKLLIEVL
jgi:hypothetical protein